jgi:hypothetical protein
MRGQEVGWEGVNWIHLAQDILGRISCLIFQDRISFLVVYKFVAQ